MYNIASRIFLFWWILIKNQLTKINSAHGLSLQKNSLSLNFITNMVTISLKEQ